MPNDGYNLELRGDVPEERLRIKPRRDEFGTIVLDSKYPTPSWEARLEQMARNEGKIDGDISAEVQVMNTKPYSAHRVIAEIARNIEKRCCTGKLKSLSVFFHNVTDEKIGRCFIQIKKI